MAVAAIVAGLSVSLRTDSAAGAFAGDALYAVLFFTIVAMIVPRCSSALVAGVAFAACALVELAQLTGIPAQLAAVVPAAALVLGTTFQATDLVAYALGAVVAGVVDAGLRRRRAILSAGTSGPQR